mmetsp:Transcript_1061/g.1854  ORF Transcript_1061/g.1854 Transcript_1061/m.1854 type:complete len:636 (-) Transcript_1061:206-2113(-)
MYDSGAPNDVFDNEESEASVLLDTEIEQASYDTALSTESGEQVRTVSSEEEEINKPWPATFERSAEILAQPIVGRELVVKATESMHILPPTKLRKNTSLSSLNRGWQTPDPVSKSTTRRDGIAGEDDEDEGFGIFDRMGLSKAPSMDWKYRPGGPATLSERQQKSVLEIKAHRQKVLDTVVGVEEGRTDDSTSFGEDQELVDDGSKTSFFGCVCNVANTLLGIGILSLPFVFRAAGWLGGLFALLTFGVVTWWTSILLGRELNGDPRPRYMFDSSSYKTSLPNHKQPSFERVRAPIKSFPAIAREAFGQKGTILLSSLMYFELFSCLAVFLVSMGDHLQTLFPNISMSNHMILVSVILMVTTAILKTPKLISYLSVVGTFTTISLVFSVFSTAFWEGDLTPEIAEQQLQQPNPTHVYSPPYHSTWISAGLPIGYGLVAFCFSGHAVIPTIYNSMERPQQFEKMISITFVMVVICCVMVAASGYYMFGCTVSDQITLSLHDAPQIDAAAEMKVLTWLMIITCFSKFSLYIFPLALGVEEIIAPFIPTDKVMEMSYSLIKFTLIVSALFVAIFIPSFSFLCSLVGLICSILVSVVFPAAAHLKLFGPHLPVWEKVTDWLFIIGGLIFAVVGTIATIQ